MVSRLNISREVLVLSFDTLIIVIHVVATVIGLVLGWGWINGTLNLIANALVKCRLLPRQAFRRIRRFEAIVCQKWAATTLHRPSWSEETYPLDIGESGEISTRHRSPPFSPPRLQPSTAKTCQKM